jgi:hypothetical protein
MHVERIASTANDMPGIVAAAELAMPPGKPLPVCDDFTSSERYTEELLHFVTASRIFQTLCGGVHILDFFVNEPGLFRTLIPDEWQAFLLASTPMELLDTLMRDDLDAASAARLPISLREYILNVRRLSLKRQFSPRALKSPVLPRHVALGMNAKKIHEVTHFAGYLDDLSRSIADICGEEPERMVDLGSGQNYLGRALASPPYNRHVVAVEGREHNTAGAKFLDVLSGLATREKVMRNKKAFLQGLKDDKMARAQDVTHGEAAIHATPTPEKPQSGADARPTEQLNAVYNEGDGKGSIRYVTGHMQNGDLSDVMSQLQLVAPPATDTVSNNSLLAMSIHSCGNLSHFGVRSLLANPAVRAIAIVGCCYNLMTERLGPPPAGARPSLQAINGRIRREEEKKDPEGFPMSNQLCNYGGHGVRFNVTARMLACQAPQNWTEKESDGFFTRHFFRAVLQKIFLDRGVITKVFHGEDRRAQSESYHAAFDMSTEPVILGSLPKRCYTSFRAYVRGAIAKLLDHTELVKYRAIVQERMASITDEEINRYEETYSRRRRELSAVWSLMAFSACLVESAIVTDRWLYLKEHNDVVSHCWVEAVFDYAQSPRNLVVVGIKR